MGVRSISAPFPFNLPMFFLSILKVIGAFFFKAFPGLKLAKRWIEKEETRVYGAHRALYTSMARKDYGGGEGRESSY